MRIRFIRKILNLVLGKPRVGTLDTSTDKIVW